MRRAESSLLLLSVSYYKYLNELDGAANLGRGKVMRGTRVFLKIEMRSFNLCAVGTSRRVASPRQKSAKTLQKTPLLFRIAELSLQKKGLSCGNL